MSLKDQFNVKGYDSTMGYVGRAFKPAASNALLVDVLKELGAIIIAKTNLPQSIMVRVPEVLRAERVFDISSGPRRKIHCGV